MAGSRPTTTTVTDDDIRRYEGLVFKTATMYEGRVEDMDLDDLRQVFRIKVWRALESFDHGKAKKHSASSRQQAQDRYVFSCVVNQGKDLLRKKKHGNLYIEDVAPPMHDSEGGRSSLRDRFEGQYQAVPPEEVYGLIDREDSFLPNTLSDLQVRVVCLLWADYTKGEIANALSLNRRELEVALDGIRTKMADWRPTAVQVQRPVAQPI